MKSRPLRRCLSVLPVALVACAATGSAVDPREPEIERFISRMSDEHGFDPAWLADLFADAKHQPSIVEAISRPAERRLVWHEYRNIFLKEDRISAGVRFWNEHRELLERIAERCGVPPEVVVAIVGVETYYGQRIGGYRVLDSLTTLAFGYPPRGKFFRSELEQFLLLTREESVDPRSAIGSYAGAMGAPQFISSSYRRYSVDFNEDGRRDLWGDWNDVLGSVANYFREHGWRTDEPVAVRAELARPEAAELATSRLKLNRSVAELEQSGVRFEAKQPETAEAMLIALEGAEGEEYWVGFRNFYVITRYNRSILYAMAVHQLAHELRVRMHSG